MGTINTPHGADVEAIRAYCRYLVRIGRRPQTVGVRRRTLATISRTTPRGLVAASEVDLADWQDLMAERVSVATRSSYVAGLRGFYSWAAGAGLVAHDPSGALLSPRVPRRQPRPLPMGALVSTIAAMPSGRTRLVLALGTYAGLRSMEIAGLRRDDVVDLDDGPGLLVREAKGGNERLVAIPSWLRAELLVHGGPVWVVERRDGGRMSSPGVQQVGRRALRAAGIPDGSMHRLRHTHATALYAASGDLRAVQEQLGHASPSTTAVYVGWSRSAAHQAVESLPTPTRRLRPVG